MPLVDLLLIALPSPPTLPAVHQCCLNKVEWLFDYFEHHPLHDGNEGIAPAQIKGGILDVGLERAFPDVEQEGALQTILDNSVEDELVRTTTTNPDHNASITPSNLHEVLQRSDTTEWIRAIHSEVDSLTHSNTFIEVDQVPAPFTPISSKFIFSFKRDVNGKVTWYKARLVAQGFSQREGVDYTNTFAPVVRLTSIHITLAIATNLNLEMDHLDVETAFLNGKIDEEIYMWAPKGFKKLNLDLGSLWRLHSSLYGLKQAPLIWNKLLDKVLKSFRWCRLSSDWCIYIWHNQKGHVMILVVHINDMLLAGNNWILMDEAKAWLAKNFKIKDMGSPRLIIGLEVIQDMRQGTIAVSQGHFIDELTV